MTNKFKELGISESLLKEILEEKFTEPTEIQTKAIPKVLEGKDVMAESATGSGKTLVFGAGILEKCKLGHGLQALVMTPTRELAEQVAAALKGFSKYMPLEIITVYGGVSINPQMKALQTADVVVGTPGRILDHMERKTIEFRNIKILVLDEADRMLDRGFIDDVEKIIRRCPKERQTLLFSATLAQDIEGLARRYMNHPSRLSAEALVDPRKLTQIYYDVQHEEKLSLLVHLLKYEHSGLVMVFCNARVSVDFVANNLKAEGINAEAIHGGFSQDKRSSTMEKFHSQDVVILVCTDVAARGLDIKGVSHVYNFDLPKDSKQYVHRIGRTARAGKEGKAVSLLSREDHDNFRRIIRDYHIEAKKENIPGFKKIVPQWTPRPRYQRFERRDERHATKKRFTARKFGQRRY